MSLAITNQGVDQDCSPSSPAQSFSDTANLMRRSVPGHLTSTDADGDSDSDSTENTTQIISTSIDPNARSFLWPMVNVSQGCYLFVANISGSSVQSGRSFLVVNGTDTSCLVAVPPVSSSSSSSSSTMSTSTTSSSSAQNTSAVTLPVSDTSGSHVKKAAIVGGVVGGIVVLAVLASALILYRYSRSSHSRRSNGSFVGKWGNLGSFDSAGKSSPARARKTKSKMYDHHASVGLAGLGLGIADPQTKKTHNPRHDSQADSIGPINASGHTQASTQEDSHSPFDEKYMRSPFSDSGHGSDEMGMVPIGYEPTSSSSAAGATAGHTTKHSSMASSTYSRSRSHPTPSPQTFPESPRNLSDVTIDSRPSETSDVAAGSAPATLTARKTSRKPVPTYNPSDPALSTVQPIRTADVPHDVRDSDSEVGLAHKSSFGSFKQMHYLIPDMPPPQRDI